MAQPITMQNAGAVVRQVRESAGLTQPELAEKIGMSQPSVSRVENTVPSLEYLIELAVLTGHELVLRPTRHIRRGPRVRTHGRDRQL